MIKKTHILSALAIFLISLFSGCKGISPPVVQKNKKKAVFIFCDVTGSLIKEESEQVAKLAADILDRLESDAVYRLVPIHMKTGTTEEILPTKSFERPVGKISDSLKTVRRNKISDEIAVLYAEVNKKEQKPERTCILNNLGRAREFFVDLDNNEYDYELIFVSDMLEHCQIISNGEEKVVSIQNQKTEDALRSSENIEFPDFSNVRITIIIPGKNQAIENKIVKPNKQILNAFWSEIFKKCKNPKVTMDDWFTVREPDRIFKPQT